YSRLRNSSTRWLNKREAENRFCPFTQKLSDRTRYHPVGRAVVCGRCSLSSWTMIAAFVAAVAPIVVLLLTELIKWLQQVELHV
ncbi:MAG: hypothetical protein ABI612_11280, partial [Betaproteobacteria bacterium]